MTNKKSILVVDDHQIVFSGIQLIMQTSGFNYDLSNCLNGDDCFAMLKARSYDLLILDVNLPDTDTFQLIGLILTAFPKQKILIFSMSSEVLYAKRFLKLGALGFVSKQASNEELVRAVSTTIRGELYISPLLSKLLAEDMVKGDSHSNVFEKLTAREFEIMSYFLSGLGSKEISNITNLHSSTIGTYKFKILEKLGIKNILELQELAQSNGIKPTKK